MAATIRGQAVAHRPLATMARKATIASACARVQCMPAPVSRASITRVLALSTDPLPIG